MDVNAMSQDFIVSVNAELLRNVLVENNVTKELVEQNVTQEFVNQVNYVKDLFVLMDAELIWIVETNKRAKMENVKILASVERIVVEEMHCVECLITEHFVFVQMECKANQLKNASHLNAKPTMIVIWIKNALEDLVKTHVWNKEFAESMLNVE